MKNKKSAMELSIGAIVVIVLAMSMLIVGLVLVRTIFIKPQFTISKDECVNEIGDYKGWVNENYDWTTDINNLILASVENNWIYIGNNSSIEKLEIYELETSCEQVKVDEIVIKTEDLKSDYEDFSKECYNNKLCQASYIDDVNYGVDIFILNKNSNLLTTDWLDENCECIECLYDYKSENIKLSLHNEKFCGGECLRYKCGEYFVEVK